ncbi:MAG: nucleotidyltransferase domain-containing protein [bacterium]
MTTTSPPIQISLPLDAIAEFCQRWKIARLEVFGSILTEEFRPESDIDFLYVRQPDARWGFDFFDLKEELESIVGRRVDLVSRVGIEKSWNWAIRRSILARTELVYAA